MVPPLPFKKALAVQRIANRFEPAAPELFVRLKMRALGPFVPGIHEDQTFACAVLVLCLLDHPLQPGRRQIHVDENRRERGRNDNGDKDLKSREREEIA